MSTITKQESAKIDMSFSEIWETLTKKLKSSKVPTIKRDDLAFILRNISTLIENGVPLPRALATVSQEKGLEKHAPVLDRIRRRVETGEAFSATLADYPEMFNPIMINQIRVGERAGTLAATLTHITAQQEKMNELRSSVIKKLAYPAVLSLLGIGVVTFMLIFVIPVFEETYSNAGVPLPAVTRLLIAVGHYASTYYWMVFLAVAFGIVAVKRVRAFPEVAYRMDRWFLRLPLIGNWLRDLAVLQMMDVLGNLLESGFRLAEALGTCADSIGNRAVRRAAEGLQTAVHRGERFSRELERHGDMFPPVVSQLVIVGEQTGNLAKVTSYIRRHLRREIERKTSIMVGTIEPLLTISLAGAIAVILLAIYLPMFDMISAVGG